MKTSDVASTTIGQSVHIRGEVTGGENLYMDGSVEGTVTLTGSRLTVGPNARVNADVAAQDVIVLGLVQGNIRAAGKVELRQTARVFGDIHSARLSMEDSATMTGRIELASPSEAQPPSPSAAVPSASIAAQSQDRLASPGPATAPISPPSISAASVPRVDAGLADMNDHARNPGSAAEASPAPATLFNASAAKR